MNSGLGEGKTKALIEFFYHKLFKVTSYIQTKDYGHSYKTAEDLSSSSQRWAFESNNGK